MGPIKTGISLAIFGVAGAAYLAPGSAQPTAALKPLPMPGIERYEVLRAGADTGCVISKGNRHDPRSVEIELGKGCTEGFGDYADARFWIEEDDGTVALATADGAVALRFVSGDGHAYEAFGAGVPLFALSDANF